MANEQRERLAPEPLAPEARLADTDAHLRAPGLRLPIAVVRLADRVALELDREQLAAAFTDPVHPLARTRLVLPAARAPAPLEPGEISVVAPAHQRRRVVVTHRPQRHVRSAQ